jgi:hypothetical protein
MLVVAVLVAALLGLAELPFAALMADDLFQVAQLEGVLPSQGPLQLFTLSDGVPEHVRAMKEAGGFPWFFDRDFKMKFFRPLSSLLLAADHALWGLWPVGYRLQGTLWLVALVASFGLLLRTALPGSVGSWALIVFAVSGIHSSLFWNAARHVVIAGALGTMALAAHVRWRESAWQPGRFLSIAGFALALLASEAAYGVLAYLFLYEALGAPGNVRARCRALLPILALIAGYLALYVIAGLGASPSGGYVDPLRAPGAFLVGVPARWLFMIGATIAGGGADLWLLRPDLRSAFALTGAAIAVAFAALLRVVWASAPEAERRGSRWLIAGAAASALPFVGSPIGSRCLVLPLLGGSVVVAFVLHGWWRTLRHRSGSAYRIASAACVLLAVIHLGLAPLARLVSPYLMRQMMYDRLVAAMQQAELDLERLPSQRVVVLRAPDFILGLHALSFRALYRLPLPRSWRTLSWARGPHRYQRTAADTLVLELPEGQIQASGLAVGDLVELEGMTAKVLARGNLGPKRVEFRFDRPLEDGELHFLGWRNGRFEHIELPAVGEWLSL